MKLKKLLAGALAAAVAVTTIAVSAFTSSAADESMTVKLLVQGTEVGTAEVTEDGQYTIKAEGLNYVASGNSMYVSAENVKGTVISANTTFTYDSIKVNGTDYDVPAEWINAAAWGQGEGANNLDAAFWNPWWTNYSIKLDSSTTITSIEVVFTLKGTGLGDAPTEPEPTDPDPTETPTGDPTPGVSAEAQLTFQSGGYEWTNWGGDTGVNTTITGDGTYTAEVNHERSHIEGMGDNATKVNVMCVDMNGFATTLGVDSVNKEITLAEKKQLVLDKGINIKDVTVTVDEGTEYEDSITLDNDKLLFGDIEGNGNFRIEIWNTYGNIKPDLPEGSEGLAYYDPAVEEFMDNLEASDSIKVTFTIEGIGGEQQPTDEPPTDEPTDEPTEQPTTEPADVTVSVIPDKAYAMPGDEVTYTVHVDTKKVPLYTVQMRLVIPEGMTYVENSGAIVDGVQAKLGYDNVAWTEQTLIINGYASAPKSVDSFDLATFKCKVDEGLADGTELAMDLTYLEFTEEGFAKIANVAVAAGVVTVGEDPNPTEPSTEPTSDDTTKAPTNGGSTTTPTDKPAGNNNNNNNNNNGGTNANTPSDKTPNTGAATAVGLSIFMAAGLAGAVAIKRRRK